MLLLFPMTLIRDRTVSILRLRRLRSHARCALQKLNVASPGMRILITATTALAVLFAANRRLSVTAQTDRDVLSGERHDEQDTN